MGQWLSGFEKLRFKVAETEKAMGEIAAKQNQQQTLRDKLAKELRKLGDRQDLKENRLTPVLLHAETLLDSMKSDQIKREKLEGKIRRSPGGPANG